MDLWQFVCDPKQGNNIICRTQGAIMFRIWKMFETVRLYHCLNVFQTREKCRTVSPTLACTCKLEINNKKINNKKINNTQLGFQENITVPMDILKKNLFFFFFIEKVRNCHITVTQSNHCPRASPTTSSTFYFKLLFMAHFFVITPKKFPHFIKNYYSDLDMELFFLLRSVTYLA